MNLLYSEIEEDLRASVRAVLTDHCPPSAVLARLESDEPYDLDLWRILTELGVTGLHVPEERGGQGASMRETAVSRRPRTRSPTPATRYPALSTSTPTSRRRDR